MSSHSSQNSNSSFSGNNNSQNHISKIIKYFVPDLLFQFHKEHPSIPKEPNIRKSPCVVLFISISIQLEEDTNILEDKSKKLLECIKDMSETIIHSGGDIIKLHQDQCLAIWTTENEELDIVVQRATFCGLSFYELCKQKLKENEYFSTIKMSLDAGDIWLLSLGGYRSNWIFYIAGEPVSQAMQSLENSLKSPYFIVSVNAWELMKNNVEAEMLTFIIPSQNINISKTYYKILTMKRQYSKAIPFLSKNLSGTINLDEDEEQNNLSSDSALLSYIPLSLQAKLYSQSTGSLWISEFRFVSIIWIILNNINYEWEEMNKLQMIVYICQLQLEHYGGCLNSIFLDKSKTVIMIEYGLPFTIYEDNADRSILLCQSIQNKLKEFGVDSKAGISMGNMIYGLIGGGTRWEQSVIGHSKIFARSLANICENLDTNCTLLCDNNVYISSKQLEFEEKIISLHQKNEIIKVYKPIRRNNLLPKQHLIIDDSLAIGLEEILNILQEKINILENEKKGQFIFIEGKPGIGKSKLVSEFHKLILKKQYKIPIYCSVADKFEKNISLNVWKEIIYDMLKQGTEMNSSTNSTAIINNIMNILGPDNIPYASLLNSILSISLPNTEECEKFIDYSRSTNAKFDKIREMLISIIDWILNMKSKILIIIDDAHWLDSCSWKLILSLTKKFTSKGLLIICLGRPFANETLGFESWNKLIELPQTLKLCISPLNEQYCIELFAQSLNVEISTIPTYITNQVLKKSRGIPLFIKEIAHMIRESGFVLTCNKRFIMKPGTNLKNLKFTDSLSINSRIDFLSPTIQLIIKVASVVGNSFSLEILREIYPVLKGPYISPSEWENSMYIMEQYNIITKVSEKMGIYLFAHALIRDNLYKMLLPDQKKQLHYACAKFYENKFSSNLIPYYHRLAHHWKGANMDSEKIIFYLEKCGQQAFLNNQEKETIRFFTDAFKYCQIYNYIIDDIKASEWDYCIALEQIRLHNIKPAKDHLINAIKRIDTPLPTYLLPVYFTKQITEFLWKHKFKINFSKDHSIQQKITFETSLQLLDKISQSQLKFIKKPLYSSFVDLSDSKDIKQQKKIQLIACIYYQLSLIFLLSQDHVLTLYCCGRCIQIAENLGESDILVKALSLHALFMSKICKFYSLDTFTRALNMAISIQSSHALCSLCFWYGLYCQSTAELDISYKFLFYAKKYAEECGDKWSQEDSCFCLSIIQLMKNKFVESIEFCDLCITQASLRGNNSICIAAMSIKAHSLWLLNKKNESLKQIEEILILLKEELIYDKLLLSIILGNIAYLSYLSGNFENSLEILFKYFEIQTDNQLFLIIEVIVGHDLAIYTMLCLLQHYNYIYQKQKNYSDKLIHQIKDIISILEEKIKYFHNNFLPKWKNFEILKPFFLHIEGIYQFIFKKNIFKANENWKYALQYSQDHHLLYIQNKIQQSLTYYSS